MQAPKRREDRGGPLSADTEQRARRILYLVGGLGFVGLAAAIALFAFAGRGGTAGADEALKGVGCNVTKVPASREGLHVAAPPKRGSYNTWPPTSGPHHEQPAPFGMYSEPIEQYRLVHNLEHGGVVVQYGDDVPPATVQALGEWYRDDPNGILVAPFPELGRQFALAAWTTPENDPTKPGTGVLAKCPRFDADAFDAFVDGYGFLGPERATRDQLPPGS